MSRPRQRGARWLWKEWVKPLLVTALLVGSFRSAFADWNDVPSGSMRPTILEGDRILVNRIAYDLRIPFTTVSLYRHDDPDRGDIVVLFSPHDGTRLVKRVVGVPGDTLAMPHDGPLVLGPDQYFVMGDNRDDSLDSRWFGPVPRDRIVGRALAVAASVDPERHYRPRWRRFFLALS